MKKVDTNHRIAKCISSQQMESSEMQKRIINLGKALVEELGLDRSVDTPARWMVHYIAEQVEIAEHATGDEKAVAEQRCFEAIIKLQQHRPSLFTSCCGKIEPRKTRKATGNVQ